MPMHRWKIKGLDAATGRSVSPIIVVAPDEKAAVEKASDQWRSQQHLMVYITGATRIYRSYHPWGVPEEELPPGPPWWRIHGIDRMTGDVIEPVTIRAPDAESAIEDTEKNYRVRVTKVVPISPVWVGQNEHGITVVQENYGCLVDLSWGIVVFIFGSVLVYMIILLLMALGAALGLWEMPAGPWSAN